MSGAAWLQVLALLVAVAVGTRLLGPYLAAVFGDAEPVDGERAGRAKAPGDRFFDVQEWTSTEYVGTTMTGC